MTNKKWLPLHQKNRLAKNQQDKPSGTHQFSDGKFGKPSKCASFFVSTPHFLSLFFGDAKEETTIFGLGASQIDPRAFAMRRAWLGRWLLADCLSEEFVFRPSLRRDAV